MPIAEVPLGLAHHEYKSLCLLRFQNTHSSSILALFKETWGQFSSHPHKAWASVCAAKRALETISYSAAVAAAKGLPHGDERRRSQEGAPFRHPVALGRGGSITFYPPTQVLFYVARQRQTMATSSPGGDKLEGKCKASFWKLSHWTSHHPKNRPWIHFPPTSGGYCPFLSEAVSLERDHQEGRELPSKRVLKNIKAGRSLSDYGVQSP